MFHLFDILYEMNFAVTTSVAQWVTGTVSKDVGKKYLVQANPFKTFQYGVNL